MFVNIPFESFYWNTHVSYIEATGNIETTKNQTQSKLIRGTSSTEKRSDAHPSFLTSGNQTWQWTIPHWMRVPLKPLYLCEDFRPFDPGSAPIAHTTWNLWIRHISHIYLFLGFYWFIYIIYIYLCIYIYIWDLSDFSSFFAGSFWGFHLAPGSKPGTRMGVDQGIVGDQRRGNALGWHLIEELPWAIGSNGNWSLYGAFHITSIYGW